MKKLSNKLIYELKSSSNFNEKLDLANRHLDYLIHHFDSKADKSKKFYQYYKYSSILLAAVTTIVSSLQVTYSTTLPLWILPIVSAGATVSVAFLGASSAQKIWINSRTTQQHLQTEKFLFHQQADRYKKLNEKQRIQLFSERLIELWNEGHGRWEDNVGDD